LCGIIQVAHKRYKGEIMGKRVKEVKAANELRSIFTMGLFKMIITWIATVLFSIITLGIGLPFALCHLQRVTAKNTVINGRRMKFTGTALGLFGSWIKWLLLTVVTVGIYGLFVPLKVKKWVVEHTTFDPETPGHVTKGESKFTMGFFDFFLVNIGVYVVSVFTLFLALPWAICYQQKQLAAHTYIDGYQLEFEGTGGALFGQYIKWFLLTVITLGLYSLWLGVAMKQWSVSKTIITDASLPQTIAKTIKLEFLPLDKSDADILAYYKASQHEAIVAREKADSDALLLIEHSKSIGRLEARKAAIIVPSVVSLLAAGVGAIFLQPWVLNYVDKINDLVKMQDKVDVSGQVADNVTLFQEFVAKVLQYNIIPLAAFGSCAVFAVIAILAIVGYFKAKNKMKAPKVEAPKYEAPKIEAIKEAVIEGDAIVVTPSEPKAE